MPLLKGPESGGYVEINRKVKFTDVVIASKLNPLPWSKVYYVDGVDGLDTYEGTSPTRAFKTAQAALTLGGRGTVIYVRPLAYKIGTGFNRYAEELTLALGGAGGTGVEATNSDISLIGITPSMNPEFGPRFKATTVGLTLDAPSLHVENIAWFAEGATEAILIRNNGATYTRRGSDGTTFYNVVIKGSGIVVADGGDGLTLDSCRFHSGYDGTSGGIGALRYVCSANPGTRLRILNSHFHGGNVTETPATCYITVLPPMTQLLLAGCKFGAIPTDGHYLDFSGASNTGAILDNFFAHANLVLETSLHIGGCVQAGNFDTAGIVV